jgi:hypothetical protein
MSDDSDSTDSGGLSMSDEGGGVPFSNLGGKSPSSAFPGDFGGFFAKEDTVGGRDTVCGEFEVLSFRENQPFFFGPSSLTTILSPSNSGSYKSHGYIQEIGMVEDHVPLAHRNNLPKPGTQVDQG